MAPVRVAQKVDDGAGQVLRIVDHAYRSDRLERGGEVREVASMGAGERGNTEHGRLQEVVPPDIDEAPADEREVRRGVEDRQLSHRVADEDVGGLVEAVRPERHRVAPAPDEGGDAPRPLHVPRHQDEAAPLHLLAHPGERVENHLLLAFVGARGDPDAAARADPVPQVLPALAGGGRHRDVQLGVAGDHHPVRAGPGRDEPGRVLAGLGRDRIHPGEGGREQAPEATVPGRGPLREAGIDVDQRDRSLGTGVDEVGP